MTMNSDNLMLVPCAIYNTRYCREMNQKGMEMLNNISNFIPVPIIAQPLDVTTKLLGTAAKIENEGVQKTIIGEAVSRTSERIVRTPQTAAVVDQMGVNDAISCHINNSIENKNNECNK